MKRTVCLILFLIAASPTTAQADVTQAEIRRIREARTLLMDCEKRSVDEIIMEFDETGLAEQSLEIYEAIAATFRDIIHDCGENDFRSRELLLARIRMNMAYFQLGGADTERPGENPLNILIRRKLKKYLPQDIWDNPKLFHSLE